MQWVSSRIWTRVAEFISYDDNNYTTGTSSFDVRSSDGDKDFFDIVADVLYGDTLAPYQFIICLDYVFQTSIELMKENSFAL